MMIANNNKKQRIEAEKITDSSSESLKKIITAITKETIIGAKVIIEFLIDTDQL